MRIVALISKQTEKGQEEKKKNKMSCLTRHMIGVTCQVSRVVCHLSLMSTATATDPSPANSTIMQRKLFCKDQKTQKFQRPKNYLNNQKKQKQKQTYIGMPILVIHSLTTRLQSNRKRVFRNGTDTHTHNSLTLLSSFRHDNRISLNRSKCQNNG